jgi:hypothetical protein
MFDKATFITLGTVLGIIVLDTLLGIVTSISQKQFNIRKLPQFLQTSILPYVGSLAILAVFSYDGTIKPLFYAAATATTAKYIAEIKDKISNIFGTKTTDTQTTLTISTDKQTIDTIQKAVQPPQQ